MIFSSNFTKLHATKITIYQEGKVKINQDKTLKAVKEDFFLGASSSVHSILMIQCV